MNLQELSLENLKEIVDSAPDGTEYYRSSNQTYYKFWHCNAWFYSELYEGWTTYPDLYNELKVCENLIKLSDIRAEFERRTEFKVGDRVVYLQSTGVGVTKVFEIIELHIKWCSAQNNGAILDRGLFYDHIRHATPAEIAAGHRIDERPTQLNNENTTLDTIFQRDNIKSYNQEQLQTLVKGGASAAERGTKRMNEREREYQSTKHQPVEPAEDLPELIICAANRDPETGKVYLCVRHGCDMFWQQIDAEHTRGSKNCCNFNQGFYTNKRRFVSREEAYIIAQQNNQIKRLCPTKSKRLYSEMLY